MDNLTKVVRDEISRQYRSVRQFAFAVDIPLSTINSALHNGVGGSSFDTVMRICKILGIKAMSDDAATPSPPLCRWSMTGARTRSKLRTIPQA